MPRPSTCKHTHMSKVKVWLPTGQAETGHDGIMRYAARRRPELRVFAAVRFVCARPPVARRFVVSA